MGRTPLQDRAVHMLTREGWTIQGPPDRDTGAVYVEKEALPGWQTARLRVDPDGRIVGEFDADRRPV